MMFCRRVPVLCAFLFPLALSAQALDLDQAAAKLAAKIATPNGTTVAVVDFTDLQGRVTELGRYYAEELSIALVNAGGLKVVDRAHLRSLLTEHKLQNSGLIDEKTAAELGRIAGVNVLVTGSVTELADSVRLGVKALNTKTAAIQAATALSLPKSATTAALLRRDVVETSSSGSPATASRVASTPSSARAFQNDFLIVSVENVALKREKDELRAYLTLSLENKSAKDEFIGIRRFNSAERFSFMDSNGQEWRAQKITGLPSAVLGPYDRANKDLLNRLPAGSRQNVMMTFSTRAPESGDYRSPNASVTMELIRYVEANERKGEMFSVGLSGITLGK